MDESHENRYVCENSIDMITIRLIWRKKHAVGTHLVERGQYGKGSYLR